MIQRLACAFALLLASCSPQDALDVSEDSQGTDQEHSASGAEHEVEAEFAARDLRVRLLNGSSPTTRHLEIGWNASDGARILREEIEWIDEGREFDSLRFAAGDPAAGPTRLALAWVERDSEAERVRLATWFSSAQESDLETMKLIVMPTPAFERKLEGDARVELLELEFLGSDNPQVRVQVGDETHVVMHDCAVVAVDAWRTLP